jgi:hypothetical protein
MFTAYAIPVTASVGFDFDWRHDKLNVMPAEAGTHATEPRMFGDLRGSPPTSA